MKVRVLPSHVDNFVGFYNHARRRPGDVFSIPDQPRRKLFPGELRLLDNPATGADAKAVYEKIKDENGMVPQDFSFRWMEPAPEGAGDKVSTAQGAVKAKSEKINRERAAERNPDEAQGLPETVI